MKIKSAVLNVDDYHEFGFFLHYAEQLGIDLQYNETGYYNGGYNAVFYVELTPEVEKLIEEEKLKSE